jgi:hypothetical protein
VPPIIEAPVRRQHVRLIHRHARINSCQLDTLKISPATLAALVSCFVDKHSSHGLGRGTEKMASTVPVPRLIAVDPQKVGFVNERVGL